MGLDFIYAWEGGPPRVEPDSALVRIMWYTAGISTGGSMGRNQKMKVLSIVCALFLVLVGGIESHAVEFKARARTQVGFGLGDVYLTNKITTSNGIKEKANRNDRFAARSRILFWLDAVISEQLSGTIQLHIGPTQWGNAATGGALGADSSNIIKLRQAYLDFVVPDTTWRTRMGIQTFSLPSAAGNSAIFDASHAAAVNTHVQLNDNVGLTALWWRPLNDNYNPDNPSDSPNINGDPANYLDNMDLFTLTLPITYEGFSVTPWVMYGINGRNSGNFLTDRNNALRDGAPDVTLTPWLDRVANTGRWGGQGLNASNFGGTSKTYGSLFWAGLPLKFSMFEPWNFELDLNYGYVEEMGRFDVMKRNNPHDVVRGSTQRQGWLAKALVEYKLDWGIPGIFGWYASGDDGNVKNGSERIPSYVGGVSLTSFMGHGNLGWGVSGDYMDKNRVLDGTWGIGAQIKDISFIDKLTHTLRVSLRKKATSSSTCFGVGCSPSGHENTKWLTGILLRLVSLARQIISSFCATCVEVKKFSPPACSIFSPLFRTSGLRI